VIHSVAVRHDVFSGKAHRQYILTRIVTDTEFVVGVACQHTRCFVEAKFEAGEAWRGGEFRHCFADIMLLLRLHSSKKAWGRGFARCPSGEGIRRTAERAKEEFDALLGERRSNIMLLSQTQGSKKAWLSGDGF
jgi:hypothetical protein